MTPDGRLVDGHPALGEAHLSAYLGLIAQAPDQTPRIDRMLTYLDRVVDLRPPKDVMVVGCGPQPHLIKVLKERGYRVVGVEPVLSYVRAARDFLTASERDVIQGSAEQLPVADATCDLVLCESVLEHVDSPRIALTEMFRVLRPGRMAFITTTNRLRFSLFGNAGEYNVRFFNWFPSLVRESYTFRHFHFDPSLANYTLRPAVHWFTFSELCQLGRDVGFAHFYSPLDLLNGTDAIIAQRWWRRLLLKPVQRRPWLRAMALTQVGHGIVMVKRPSL